MEGHSLREGTGLSIVIVAPRRGGGSLQKWRGVAICIRQTAARMAGACFSGTIPENLGERTS